MDPMVLVVGALVLGAISALYVSAKRATTIADLAIERGTLRVERGGIAPSVLVDLKDVVRHPPIAKLRIRIVRASGRAEVELHGSVSENQAQQIRNVVGSVPLARLANARRRR